MEQHLHCPDPDSFILPFDYRTGVVVPGPDTTYYCQNEHGLSEPSNLPVTLLPEVDPVVGLLIALGVVWGLRGLRWR